MINKDSQKIEPDEQVEAVEVEPWERRTDESDKAWEAFRIYRDQHKRSLTAVAQQLSKSRPLIKRWSSRYDWVERVRSLDDHTDRAWLDALFHQRVISAKEQYETARALCQRLYGRLAEAPVEDLTFSQCVRLLVTVFQMERDALDDAVAIREEEQGDEARPPVVVIYGADQLV